MAKKSINSKNLIHRKTRSKTQCKTSPFKIFEMHESGATDSWAWEAWLSRSPEGIYCVELSQQTWGSDLDHEPTTYTSQPLRSGQELFEFLNSSWMNEHEESLDQRSWFTVVESVKSVDAALAEEIQVAITVEFEQSIAELPHAPTEFQRCVTSATWERTHFSGGGAMWASIAERRLGDQAVNSFVRNYFETHGALPRGPHHVRVTIDSLFDNAGYETETWPSVYGVFDKIVNFSEVE